MTVNTEKITEISFSEVEIGAIEVVYNLFDTIATLVDEEYDGFADMIPLLEEINGMQEVTYELIELEKFLNILDFEKLTAYKNWKITKR